LYVSKAMNAVADTVIDRMAKIASRFERPGFVEDQRAKKLAYPAMMVCVGRSLVVDARYDLGQRPLPLRDSRLKLLSAQVFGKLVMRSGKVIVRASIAADDLRQVVKAALCLRSPIGRSRLHQATHDAAFASRPATFEPPSC